MLNPREAQQRLKEYERRNWQFYRQLTIGRLPSAMQPLFTQARFRYRGGLSDRRRARLERHYRRAEQWLGSTWKWNRRRVFRIMFSGLSNHVMAGWDLFQNMPYQSGMQRKAFRAPHNPAIVNSARISWLISLFGITVRYKGDVRWLAEWAPYLGWGSEYTLGVLFAAAINRGDKTGDEVFQILCQSATGEHAIGRMGRHITTALLVSSREDGWEFVENLLLAAQRQEGLRQAILEAVDESHPEAFRRMLDLILSENLIRLSSVIRAASIWFGLGMNVTHKTKLKDCIEMVLGYLSAQEIPTRISTEQDPLNNYLQLWSIAFRDAEMAIHPALEMLDSDQVSQRFAGAYLLSQLNLTRAHQQLIPVLDDPDLAVAAIALEAFKGYGVAANFSQTNLFEAIEKNLERFPKRKKTIHPEGFSWMDLSIKRSEAAKLLLASLGRRSTKRLIPHLSLMEPFDRASVADLLAKKGSWDQDKQDLFIQLLGDRSGQVREKALEEVSNRKIRAEDLESIESLLKRKAGDLRRGIISILLKQKDKQALLSATRLLQTGDHMQRLAGLEILRLMQEQNRKPDACAKLTSQYTEESDVSSDEQVLVEQIVEEDAGSITLDDCLGLINPKDRTRPTRPRSRVSLPSISLLGTSVSATARQCLISLDDLIYDHRDNEVIIEHPVGKKQELLGNVNWLQFRMPGSVTAPVGADYPLRELLNEWWDSRGKKLQQKESLVFYQALALNESWGRFRYTGGQLPGWEGLYRMKVFGKALPRKIKYPGILPGCLEWLFYNYPVPNAVDPLLDAVEFSLRSIPKMQLFKKPDPNVYYTSGWRSAFHLLSWLRIARIHREFFPEEWGEKHHQRLWGLLRWMDEPGPTVPRHRPNLDDVIYAYQAGAANDSDVIDHLIGPRRIQRYGIGAYKDFSQLSRRNPPQPAADSPQFMKLVDRCRKRVCEVELTRGDMPTEASGPAIALRWSGGIDIFLEVLKSLGKAKLVRGWIYHSNNKASVLSRLLRVTYPGPEDTFESMADKLSNSKLSEKRLIQAAVYAPQWAEYIESWLGWEGFSEGVWWIHAHTKDNRWSVEQEIRDEWKSEINSRTPLTAEDLLDGAVDVSWFKELYQMLGPERWTKIYDAAVYASGGSGHTRAKLFADAMLEEVTRDEVIQRLTKKRHQDSVRALGLIPLPDDDSPDHEILERYQTLQEFKRTSRKFGSQRQASEKLAVRIGLENLARTAGYPDPSRLQWAMEVDEIADLAQGPVVKEVGDYRFTLSINSLGEAEFAVTRDEKKLKSVPAKHRKDPEIKQLRNRKTNIKRQASRMRFSLEEAMCRGDQFMGEEFSSLLDHPVLRPMVSQLIFTGEKSVGYLNKSGDELIALDGSAAAISKGTPYRLAHPYDLLDTGRWQDWQRDCFQSERIQPFKQVFRELYLLTSQEKEDHDRSRRYAGHQVNPRQSLAILGKRGWVTRPESGIQRTFHNQRITAHVQVQGGYLTPQVVEGITIDIVHFNQRGDWKPLSLSDVPPRVFSETMRDLDLVVSVAHMGGVDPEASASTVEMRTTLLKETCGLLEIENVRIKGNHALIDGELNDYTVHLGSAVVHQQPGGAVCLVPVHAQHRGRIFLPFVDDDPRTAEVIAKVLLLAKDKEIKDPTILEQLIHNN